MDEYQSLIGGEWRSTNERYELKNPYNQELIAVVSRPSPEEALEAVERADRAFEATRAMPSWKRAEILQAIAEGIKARHDELSRTIALEAGKPIKQAQGEVSRAANTFWVAMEEAKRIQGELMSLDWMEGHEGRLGLVRRFPIGPMLGISPFNFPLNLVAHKVAPAIAVGAPLIIKPATQTPLSSLKLGEIVLESGWPPEAFSVLPCSGPVAEGILQDDRIKKLTFTGSPEVGWHLKALVPKKRVTLELGEDSGVWVAGLMIKGGPRRGQPGRQHLLGRDGGGQTDPGGADEPRLDGGPRRPPRPGAPLPYRAHAWDLSL